MTTMSIAALKAESNTVRQFGNHVFARTGDLISVYEVASYRHFEPATVRDLNKTYTITNNTTWDDVTSRFFGTPTAPSFCQVLKV